MKKEKPLTDIHIRKTVRGFSLFYNVFLISNDVNTFVKAVSCLVFAYVGTHFDACNCVYVNV